MQSLAELYEFVDVGSFLEGQIHPLCTLTVALGLTNLKRSRCRCNLLAVCMVKLLAWHWSQSMLKPTE